MRAEAKRSASWARYIPFAVLAFFFAAAFFYQKGLDAKASVGEPAPNFALESLGGGEVALESFRGKTVVVNFWTTWCKECRFEAPDLEAVHRRFDDVVVLGVDMREPESVVRPFVEEFGLTYPILLDRDQKVSKSYRVTGVPETWIVDRDGVARYHHVGPIDAERLEAIVSTLEAEGSGGAPAISS